MAATMAAEKIRLVLKVDDELRAALRLEAAKRDVEMSELASDILGKALADSLEEVRQRKANRPKK